MNYWLILNGVKLGPLTIEQVRALNLKPDTPVWYPGLPDWVTAADVALLSDTIEGSQPPHCSPCYPQQPYAPVEETRESRPCPSTHLAWSIVVTLLCCLIPGIVAIVYSSQVENKYIRGDYDGALKASNRAEAWIIAAIILGLLAVPFQIICWAL